VIAPYITDLMFEEDEKEKATGFSLDEAEEAFDDDYDLVLSCYHLYHEGIL
jgi:hypothetical protein